MSAALNNSIKYSSTSLAPTQVIYGFRTREALNLLRSEDYITPNKDSSQAIRPDNAAARPDKNSQSHISAYPITRSATRRAANKAVGTPVRSPETPIVDPVNGTPATSRPVGRPPGRSQKPSRTLPKPSPKPSANKVPVTIHKYRPSHIDTKDTIAFATIRMKAYYDSRHQPHFFNINNLVNLRLNRGYQLPSSLGLKKIVPQLVGPFKVIKRIGRLAYRLELPGNIRIHNVISVAHLEPATDPSEDPYHRHHSPPPAVTIDGEDEYIIDKLVRKRRIRKGRSWSVQYLIRWKGYGPEYDTWQPERDVADTKALDEYERLYGTTSGIVHVNSMVHVTNLYTTPHRYRTKLFAKAFRKKI